MWNNSVVGETSNQRDEEIELDLCMDYCEALYDACKNTLLFDSERTVSDAYGSPSAFCRFGLGKVYDVRLQTTSGICYPVAPGTCRSGTTLTSSYLKIGLIRL